MDIITKARELGQQIQLDERYKAYTSAKEKMDADSNLQELINKFNLKRMDLSNEINKGEGADEERKSALDKEIREIYADIMSSDNMMAFAATKEKLDEVINQVNTLIMMTINGEDPLTCNVEHSCSGNCGSCGGCH